MAFDGPVERPMTMQFGKLNIDIARKELGIKSFLKPENKSPAEASIFSEP
jgi:hypothetical protein